MVRSHLPRTVHTALCRLIDRTYKSTARRRMMVLCAIVAGSCAGVSMTRLGGGLPATNYAVNILFGMQPSSSVICALEAESVEFDGSRYGERARRVLQLQPERSDSFDMHAHIVSWSKFSIGMRGADSEPWLRVVSVLCTMYPSHPAAPLTGTMIAGATAEMRRHTPEFSRALGPRAGLLTQIAQPGAGAAVVRTATTFWIDWRGLGVWIAMIGLPTAAGAGLGHVWHARRARRRLRGGLCPECLYPLNPDRVCTECGFHSEIDS